MSSANQPGLPPILDSMSRIQGAVLRELVELMARSGFPEVRLPQANLLTSILPRTGIRMSELADNLKLTRGAVTQLVAPLESAGLVVRERHPTDGRGVVVKPTRRALRGYAVAFRWTVEKYSDWERLVGTDRWETFLDVLYQIATRGLARPA
jgi:DNA-binding MarR family transcriptional regulator